MKTQRVVPAALLVLSMIAPVAFAQMTLPMDDPNVYPNLRIGGFTDFNFYAIDQDEGVTSGFTEGQFVLHFTSALSPRFSFFGEVSLVARDTEFRVNVERAILRFDQSDALRISFGRYHSPINWWNNAFHHGQWLQTSIARPEMTMFGGRFIPVHFVGALAEGQVPSGGLNLNYKAGVGNGRNTQISGAGDAGDSNNNRAWLVNLFVRPDAVYGLEAGASYYRDDVPFTNRPELDEDIVSAYVVWTKETPEVIAEWAKVEHEDTATGQSWSNDAYYIQAAYRLPIGQERWKPYVRYERIDIDEKESDLVPTAETFPSDPLEPIAPDAIDPAFSTLVDRRISIIGLRWDPTDNVAFKLEFRRTRSGDADDVDALHAQVSYGF